MDLQNLAYALTQLVHNFGAVAVTGGAVAALWPEAPPEAVRRRLAGLVLGGWLAQALSGAGFGAVSHHYYGQFPDIHDVAVAALVLKVACAAAGAALAAFYLARGAAWTDAGRKRAWRVLAGLAATALSAAAVLRWFS